MWICSFSNVLRIILLFSMDILRSSALIDVVNGEKIHCREVRFWTFFLNLFHSLACSIFVLDYFGHQIPIPSSIRRLSNIISSVCYIFCLSSWYPIAMFVTAHVVRVPIATPLIWFQKVFPYWNMLWKRVISRASFICSIGID